tara:strand:+ start:72 stop:311 length:240 start_codon:yes stop_codon:yes gene_type:complete
MEDTIIKILKKKIDEIKSKNNEIQQITDNLSNLDSISFSSGIITGRLYNSFHYQHRRILNRNPTNEEFKEFIEFLKNNL